LATAGTGVREDTGIASAWVKAISRIVLESTSRGVFFALIAVSVRETKESRWMKLKTTTEAASVAHMSTM
jgi:hypothetical protein